MGTTAHGLVYPESDGHTRLWEHLQTLAESVDAALPVGGYVELTTDATGLVNVPHGLASTPSGVSASIGTGGSTYRVFVAGKDATNIQVRARKASDNTAAPAGTTIGVHWIAVP